MVSESAEAALRVSSKIESIMTELGYYVLDGVNLNLRFDEDSFNELQESDDPFRTLLDHCRQTREPLLFTTSAIVGTQALRPTVQELVADLGLEEGGDFETFNC